MPKPDYSIVVEPEGEGENVTYAARCQVYAGTPAPCGFVSNGWKHPEAAGTRLAQHHDEHRGVGLTPELHVFQTGYRHEDWVDDGDPNVPVEGIPADAGVEG